VVQVSYLVVAGPWSGTSRKRPDRRTAPLL